MRSDVLAEFKKKNRHIFLTHILTVIYLQFVQQRQIQQVTIGIDRITHFFSRINLAAPEHAVDVLHDMRRKIKGQLKRSCDERIELADKLTVLFAGSGPQEHLKVTAENVLRRITIWRAAITKYCRTQLAIEN